MSERYGVFSVYAPETQPASFYSGYRLGGPDDGQGVDIPAGWDPYEVLRRYAAANDYAEEASA